jgi:hypothetical protein
MRGGRCGSSSRHRLSKPRLLSRAGFFFWLVRSHRFSCDMHSDVPSWAREIIERLDRIEKLVGRTSEPEQAITMTTREVCAQTGHSNYFGLHTWSKKWKLKQVSKGRYLREDVKLAMARASFIVPTRRGSR